MARTKTTIQNGPSVSLTETKAPNQFYFQIEDEYGNYSQVTGPFPSQEAALNEVARATEYNDVCGIDVDEDSIDDLRIEVYEIAKVTRFKAAKAGIQFKECK